MQFMLVELASVKATDGQLFARNWTPLLDGGNYGPLWQIVHLSVEKGSERKRMDGGLFEVGGGSSRN